MLCIPQHNQTWVGAKLGHAFICAHSPWYAEEGNLCCVALAVSFSGFHSSRHLICCTDWTVMLISSLLWGICSSLDSGLLATAVKVSKSRHNSTIKSLIQNSPILFQDKIALSLHCTFQPLVFSDCWENVNSISQNDTLTHSLTHTRDDYHMPPAGSAHRSIIICEVHWWRPGMVASLGHFSNGFKSTLQQLIVVTTSSSMMPACDRCTAITHYVYFGPPTNYCF